MSNFISKLIDSIGHFFQGLFNAAEKAWDRLEPEIQDALTQGSGIIAIINENLDKTPDFVYELLQDKFPTLTKEKIQEGLNEVDKQFGTASSIPDADLLTTIKNIQVFLSGLKGKTWESISSSMAQLIAITFSPNQTPFAKISMLIEYAYNKYIKK